MKLFKIILVISLSVFMALTSCVTSKKLTYLQYAGSPLDTVIMVTPSSYKIQPFDNLYIRVITPDPQWSDMFNSMPANTSSNNMNEQSADLISYTVDSNGNIELPYAGRFSVAGKTLNMVKTDLENVLKGYISDAAIIVKMINNYVSIIGDVQNPGRYPIYKDRMNIFQALAMAGDLGEFSDRSKVQLIRQTSVGTTIKEFSLNDRTILSSEFFYVMPNDVIYAQPIKGKFFQMDAFPYSIILSTITTFILILNVVK